VSVLYPNEPGSRFDVDYYLSKHIPLVRERWGGMGLEDVQVFKGKSAAGGGSAPYQMMALLRFRSLDDFGAAVDRHGGEVLGDVPNFTSVQPAIQVNEPAG
jgi:uncharacterized protein (TIGR02118 family)